ncbi:MAG: adenylate/guanylate cyclase domain-containing protein, partial [Bacteroidota bacterium]
MNQDKKRRLAAIMFADIVGYTAMMQRNEAEGLISVHRFSEVMEAKTKIYHGEILEFRGDGCLVVFDSAVEAVHAANAIQKELQLEPLIPLRIGIHLGDIVFTKGNIYGDGVNLASRVESMAVPGSILVTERVIHDVKSHPEFEMTSLGQFQFKNVEKPMEVYALANEGLIVPLPEEMQGKGDRVGPDKARTKSISLLAFFVFTAAIIGVILFWVLTSFNQDQNKLLTDKIREEKVAVGVFENFTGDKSLDALGYFGSEWVSSGLRELKVPVVSPDMVRLNKDKMGVLPNNPSGSPSFAEITGAKYLITGSYFLQEDSLVLNTRLSSTETGEEIRAFPNIVRNRTGKEQLMDEVRQLLLGYWVLKRDQKLPNINPPKYEAYQAYLKCRPTQAECFQFAVDLDPDFLLARIFLMQASSLRNMDSIYYANKTYVEERWNLCTEYEKNWFRVSVFSWENNMKGTLESQEAIYQLDSNDYMVIHQTAYVALNGNNMPHKAIKKFDRLFGNIDLYKDQILEWSFHHYLDALNRTGQYKRATDFYFNLSETQKKKAGLQSIHFTLRALIHQNRIKEALEFIKGKENEKISYLKAAYVYNYLYPDSSNNPFYKGLKTYLTQFTDSNLGAWETTNQFYDWNSKSAAYYVLKNWEKAEEILLKQQDLLDTTFDQVYQDFPENDYWEKIWHTSRLGCIYAQQGKVIESKACI